MTTSQSIEEYFVEMLPKKIQSENPYVHVQLTIAICPKELEGKRSKHKHLSKTRTTTLIFDPKFARQVDHAAITFNGVLK